MNKHLHRIIFNAARGVRMAVQETATSTGKGRNGGSGGGASGVVALAAVLAAFAASPAAQAQIIGAGNVPGSLRPTVLTAPNGVPLVNIQTPSAAGVSRNIYQQFDVQSQGVILNNSRSGTSSQLGATVAGNPWLAGAPARVILNEINSGNPSQLRGYIEVAGQRAEVIIANPAGISVDGAGFINASRATLTTGAPQMNLMGGLEGFLVQGGTIAIEGQGLNAGTTDYAAIIARAVQVNAGIWASELKVVTGANEVSADASASKAVEPSGAAPVFALDVAQLGGMYARKIVLVGTEAGVGVRNAGVIGADGALAGPGSLVVTAAGRLENVGTVQSTGTARIEAQSLANTGKVQAGDELDIRTQGALSNAGGTIESRRVLMASAEADIDNRGGTVRQASSAGLGIEVQTLSNTAAGWIGAVPPAPPAPAPAPAPDTGAPPAPAPAPEAPAPAPAPSTGEGGAQTPSPAPEPATPPAPGVIRAAGALLNDGGQILAGGAIDIAPTQLDNTGGTVQAATLSATGARLGNAGGTLQVSGAFSAQVGQIDNAGGTLSAASVTAHATGAIDNRGGTLQSDGALQLTAGGAIDNSQGRITAFDRLDLEAGGALNNAEGQLQANQAATIRADSLDNRAGQVQSAQAGVDMRLTGALRNDGGSVAAARDLQLNAGSVAGGTGTVRAGADATINVTGALATNGHATAGGHLTITAASLDAGAASVLGAGVRADGSLATDAADPGDLRVRTTGTLAAHGHNPAAGDVVLQGASLDLSGSTTQGASVQLQADSGAVNLRDATVSTAGTLRLSTPQGIDNSGGSLTAGGLDLQGASLRNVGGELVQTGTGNTRLAVRGDIDNTRGLIATNGQDFTLSAAALVNDQGRIEHAGTGTMSLQAGRYQAQGGTILSNGQLVARTTGAWAQNGGSTSAARITLEAASIANAGGQIVQWGEGSTRIAATGALDNIGGRIATNGDSAALSAASIANAGGRIEHAGTGAFTLRSGGALNNQSGLIASSGALDLDAGAVNNLDGRIDAKALDLAAASLANQGGSILQGGSADTRIAIAGALDNQGGIIATNGQGVQLSAAQVDNRAGQIEHAGSGAFALDAGSRFTGDGGSVLSNGQLQLKAGTVSHDNATLAAQGVAIQTDSLSNRGGQILQTGAGSSLDIAVRGTLDNQAGGHIAANGQSARITSATLLNSGGLIEHANASGTLALEASTLLDNTQGQIVGNGTVAVQGGALRNDAGSLSGGALDVQVSSLSNQGGQLLHTGTGAGAIDVAGALDNHQGLIASNGQDFTLAAGGALTNTEGTIQHAGTGTLALSAQSIDSTQGLIASNGQLVGRVQGAFDQQGGQLTAAQIDLQAASFDNRGASITQTGARDIAIDITGRLDNAGGLIATNGAGGSIAADTLANSSGRIEHAGSGTLWLNGRSTLDNSSGTVLSNGTLGLEGGAVNNDEGVISAQGLQATVQSLSNRQGSIVQSGTEAGALHVAGALDNHQGLIATNAQDFTLAAGGTLTNTEGTIQHAGTGTLALSAQSIDGAQGQIVSNGQLVGHVLGAFDQQGGVLSAAQIDLQAASLDNRNATVSQTGAGDTTIDITGQIDNRDGLITTNGAGGQLSAGTLLNSLGRVEHAGTGTFTVQTEQQLDNAEGLLASNGTLALRGGAVDNQQGVIAAQQIDADVAALDNRQGQVQHSGTGAGRLATQGALDNSGGQIATNGSDFALSAGGLLSNTGGSITHAGTGRLGVDASQFTGQGGQMLSNGLLDLTGGQFNHDGGIASAEQVRVDVASLSNRDGQIVQNGTGTTDIRVSGVFDNSDGLLASNGQSVSIDAGQMANRQGQVQAAADNGTLSLNTASGLDNSGGQIAGNGQLSVTGGALQNGQGGSIGARQIGIQVASLGNQGGQIVQSGTGATHISATGDLDNSGGLIATNGRNLSLGAGGTLANAGGVIQHAGDGLLAIDAGLFDARGGQMLTNGDLSVSGGSFIHDGVSTTVRGLTVDVQHLSNAGGALLQTGSADTLIRATQSLNNSAGGRIASAGTNLTVVGAHLNNDGGAIEHATLNDQGLLTVRAGQLSNDGGQIVANASLRAEGGVLDNSGGQMRGEHLSIDAQGLINRDGGEILQTGAEETRLNISGAVDNSGGQIASNGALTVNAGSWMQHGGELRSATGKNLTLDVTGLLDTGESGGVGGTITSGADLIVRAGQLRNDAAGGAITAEQNAEFTVTGDASSQGGLLAAGKALELSAANLDTSGGTVAALGGDLTLAVQALTRNHAGTIQATGDVNIDTGDLINSGDATKAGSIGGQNLNVTTHVTGLRNDGGTLWAHDAIVLDLQHSSNPGGLSNNAGLIQSGGALVIDTHSGVLLNHNAAGHASGQGGIASGAALTVVSGEVNNSQGGFIGAAGDIGLLAGSLNNAGGQILGAAQTQLAAAGIDNQGGRIESVGALRVWATDGQAVNNQGGLIRSMDHTDIKAASVNNSGTGGTEQGIEGATVQITTDTLNNQGGAVRAAGDATITSAGHIDNSNGLISAGGVLHLQDAGVAQNSGNPPTLVVTNTNGTLVGDKGLKLDVARFTTDGKLASGADLTLSFTGDVVNEGEIIAVGNLNYSTDGTLTNKSIITAGQVLHAKAGGLVNEAGAEISAGHTILDIAGNVTNRGLIDSSGQTVIKAGGTIDNIGTGRIYGDHVSISANQLNNVKEGGSSATIAARNRLDIGAQQITNSDGALIYSRGDMAIKGSINPSTGEAEGSGTSLSNLSATIESGGSMNIAMGSVLNKDIYLTVGQPTVSEERGMLFNAWILSVLDAKNYSLEDTYYEPYTPENPSPDGQPGRLMHIPAPGADPIDVSGSLWRLYDNRTVTTTDTASGAKPAQIIAGGNMSFVGHLSNQDGQVVAGGTLSAQSVDNKATEGKIVTDLYINMYAPTTLSKTEIDLSQWALQNFVPIHQQSSKTIVLSQHRYEGNASIGGGHSVPGAGGTPTTGGSVEGPGNVGGGGNSTITEVIVAVGQGQDVNAGGANNIAQGSGTGPTQVTDATGANGPGADSTGNTQVGTASGGADTANGENAGRAEGGASGAGGSGANSAQGGAGLAGAQGAGKANASTANAAVGNTGPGGTSASGTGDLVVRTTRPNAGVPTSSLYVTHPGSGSSYLVGTDPRFTQGGSTTSSDQLLAQLGLSTSGGYNGEYTLKRLGDGWYEQELIKQQVLKLTGYRYLDGYSSDTAQYAALINAGATFAKKYNLRVGVALTEAQMAQLTSDIVWLVEQTVTLPDGTRERVLVPQVYVRAKKGDIDGSGALLSGNKVILDAPEGKNVFNSGTIAGRELVSIKADTIDNLGGRISSQKEVLLDARKDINIVGGTVDAGNKIDLKAVGDINVRTTTSTTTTPNGLATTTVIDRVAGLYVTNPGGTLVASAGNDLNIVGAVIRNAGSGSTELTAGKNVNITTVKTGSNVAAFGSVGAATGYVVSNKAQEVGSVIDVGGGLRIEAKGGDLVARQADIKAVGDITMKASQDVRLEAGVASESSSRWGQTDRMTVSIDTARNQSVGTSITSTGGKIDITAGRDFASRAADVSAAGDLSVTAKRDIFIGTGWDSQAGSIEQTDTSRGGLSTKTTNTNAVSIVDKATGGTFSGQNVTLKAGTRDDSGAVTDKGNISLVGVDIVARGDATLNATGNVNIVSAQESSSLVADRSETRSGVFSMGGALNTHANRGDTATQETTTHRGSTVTAGGKIDVTAGGSATIYASDLTAQDAVRITGKDVSIISGVDTVSGSYGTRKSSDGESGLLPRMGTGFGNEATTDNSVSISTLAPASVTGKSVTITATEGDITLAAAKVKSTGMPENGGGVTLNAESGAVNLLVVKTGEEVSHTTGGSDIAYQRSSDEGHLKEEANYTTIETAGGGKDVKFNTGTVNVGVGQTALRIGEGDQAFLVPVQTIAGALEGQSGQPGMEWIDQLKAKEASGELTVNWEGVPLEYRQWAQDQSGLTGAGAAIVTAVVTYFTAGVGSGLVGTASTATTTAGTVTTTTLGGLTLSTTTAGVTTFSGWGLAVNAGFTALASQTAVSLINNNGDLGKVLQELGSSNSIKNLVGAMLTAGALDAMGLNATGYATSGAGPMPWGDLLVDNLKTAGTSALIDTALYGGSLGDRLEDALKNALINTAAAKGANFIGDLTVVDQTLDTFTNKVAHAIAGCAAGAAKADNSGACGAGALGAVIGEITAEIYGHNSNTVALSGLMATLGVAIAGGSPEDISIANSAGQNAAVNNYLNHPDATRLRQLTAACSTKCTPAQLDEMARLLTQDKSTTEVLNACSGSQSASCDRVRADFNAAAQSFLPSDSDIWGWARQKSDASGGRYTAAQIYDAYRSNFIRGAGPDLTVGDLHEVADWMRGQVAQEGPLSKIAMGWAVANYESAQGVFDAATMGVAAAIHTGQKVIGATGANLGSSSSGGNSQGSTNSQVPGTEKNIVPDVPEGVPYFRVQGGGTGTATSRNALSVNEDGSVFITPGCTGSICVSVGNSDHASYYLSNRRPDGSVIVFEVDRATHNKIMEAAVSQFGNSGAGVKITDTSTPGTSIELDRAYSELMASGSSRARTLTQQEFFDEFGRN